MDDKSKALALLDAWASDDETVEAAQTNEQALGQQQRERLWALSGAKTRQKLQAPLLR